MGVLIVILYVLEVLVSACLIGIILIQQPKNQGGLGALAGGMTESVFGASTGNVITKATVALATIFMVNTLLLAILTAQLGKRSLADELAEGTGDVRMEETTGTGETATTEQSAGETSGDAVESTEQGGAIETDIETDGVEMEPEGDADIGSEEAEPTTPAE